MQARFLADTGVDAASKQDFVTAEAITSINLKVFMPSYLAASLLCSINLLFVIVAVLLLSLRLPDIVAFLCVLD